jgi:protein SCO1
MNHRYNIIVALLAALSVVPGLMAQEHPLYGPTKVSIPDSVVLDQNNRKLHFYSDLVQGKTVAINFIFTTCTTICPPLTANFAKLQKLMRDRGVKNLQLISVSVDPEADTPQKMKSYAEMFHAGPGWTFVTGTRAELEPIWRAFSVYTSNKQDHPATVVIGNDARHIWNYASGLASAGKLAAVIQSTLDGKRPLEPGGPGNEAAQKRAPK